MVYIEKLSCVYFVNGIFKHNLLAHLLGSQKKTFTYFDATYLATKIIVPLFNLFKCDLICLNFKMTDILDEYGEIERIRIPRKDLFEIRSKIMLSNEYKNMFNSSWKKNRVLDCINDEIVDSLIPNELSAARLVYLLKVIDWNMRFLGVSNSIFHAVDRPGFIVLIVSQEIVVLKLLHSEI